MTNKGEDVVVGSHADDADFAEKVTDSLLTEGLSVWHADSGVDAVRAGIKKTQAILACKVFIAIISEHSVSDKQFQDQLSLAYISNSCIFPLSNTRYRFLAPKLSGGAKLILAKINWCFVLKPEEHEKNIHNLIQCIKLELDRLRSNPDIPTKPAGISTHGFNFSLMHGLDLGDKDGYEGSINPSTQRAALEPGNTKTFWDRHFPGKKSVEWVVFQDKFLSDYGNVIEEEFKEKAEERKTFIMNLMYRDVFQQALIIDRSLYDEFCLHHEPGPDQFFNCLQNFLMAYVSLREVFSMDSSLRISTIQSLGKFTFPAIVAGLGDMLVDEDANTRAVAAIALAHAGKSHHDTVDRLLRLMHDEDRLVRESACLSLGYLGAAKSVGAIVEIWRNDPISTVREAAELALRKMNVAEAQQCIKITTILSNEMSALKAKA